ncbi:hypothetical protein DR950_14765 [Kitasatospora xanthocidica]|uniref:Uncharacterized protein n=1 Tax=Kitasatospora xanthocidica TaxID=83382 RepID=A0A372ZTS2_9ACTN|nr:DUF6571 family protein [Kitasatospora xanthocidica]RGD58872.1 hypothetical protein DR950_14765 [Kitasatospora xanthocidica]
MVSFKELHEADFSGVSDAAEAWAGVAKALTALDGRVTKDLTSTAQRAGWKGDAADAATTAMQGMDGDFKQASAVATALAAIMKTAAEDFTAARRDLDTAIHDALTENMTVSADGQVNWTLPKEARNDTDGEKLAQGLRAKAEAIAARLTKAVEKAAAADQRASVALQGDIGTSTTSFNPTPYGGGPVADANRAKDLMAKAGSLSDDQLKQLQALMAANAENKDFSTTLLNGLNYGGKTGPDALLEYSRVYDGLAHGNHNAAGYQDVYKNLSVALASATRDGGMGKAWEDGLLAAARRPGGSAAGYNDNYPALTALLNAKGSFDKGFLTKVGTDLVDYERGSKLKGADLWGPDWSNATGHQGDPMRDLMQAMSRNPEASKDFLDPAANKNLDYLLKARQWPNQGYEHNQLDPVARNNSRGAFGDALEAATTGRDPNGNQPPVRPHDAAMARIMSDTITHFGGDSAGHVTELPVGLRRPFGNMIADYAADTYEIIGKEVNGHSETSGLVIDRDRLIRVIRGVSDDPEAFRAIHYAESQEMARRLDAYPADTFRMDQTGHPNPGIEGYVREAGQVLGALSGTQSDVMTRHHDDVVFQNNWQAKMNYHLIGTPLTPVPVVGDFVQRMVDVGTSEWANGLNSKQDQETQADLSKMFNSGENQLKQMIVAKAEEAGLTNAEIASTAGVPQKLLHDVSDSYGTGVNQTYRNALGGR